MTTDESLRATLHVIVQMQNGILRALQSGSMDGHEAIQLLKNLDWLSYQVNDTRKAAAINPSEYAHYAAPGQSANRPSDN